MACCSPELQSALATPRQLVRCINRGRRSALRGRSQAATRFLLQGPPAQQLLAPAGAPPQALLSKLAFWLGVSSGCLPEWRERERGRRVRILGEAAGTRERLRAHSDQYSLFFNSINVRLKKFREGSICGIYLRIDIFFFNNITSYICFTTPFNNAHNFHQLVRYLFLKK